MIQIIVFLFLLLDKTIGNIPSFQSVTILKDLFYAIMLTH